MAFLNLESSSLISCRERDLAVTAILAMAGKKPNEMSDGTVAFCFGDCQMGSSRSSESYLTFQSYLVKKLRQWNYFITFEDEYFTSQKFPILGHQTNLSGDNGIRIKYCREANVHINRDIMAAENMADILASRMLNLERPHYLSRPSNIQSVRL